MHMSGEKILVLGATGKTGVITLSLLKSLGFSVEIAGRNKTALQEMAKKYDAPYHLVDISDISNLRRLFIGFKLVINFIGPFSKLGYLPVEAAIDTKTNYIDSSWEQEYFSRIFSFDDYVGSNSVTIAVGIGVSPGLSELLFSVLSEEFDRCSDVSIFYVEGMGNIFSYGSLISTSRALKSQCLHYINGAYRAIKVGSEKKTVTYNNYFGKQTLINYPSGDVINIPRYSSVNTVKSFFGAEFSTFFLLLLKRFPFKSDSRFTIKLCKLAEKLNSTFSFGNMGFTVAVQVTGILDGKKATKTIALSSKKDPYSITAAMIAKASDEIMNNDENSLGVVSAGQAFNGRKVLFESGAVVDSGITIYRQ